MASSAELGAWSLLSGRTFVAPNHSNFTLRLMMNDFELMPRYGLGQFVELHILNSGRFHGSPDLRQLDRSADDGESTAAIDDGFNADGLIDLRSGLKRALRGLHFQAAQ